MTDLNIDGMVLAPGVVETIISIAANEVDGVASVGAANTGGFRQIFGVKPAIQGIEIDVTENDKLKIAVRIDVYYGYPLPDVATAIRSSIVDAVTSQIGIPVESVDIYVDGIRFVN